MLSIPPLPTVVPAGEAGSDLAVHPVLIVAVIAIVFYLASCKFHPYMKCKACNKSKESHSTTFKGAFGKCRVCNGKGHSVRWGARFLGHKD
ncbi:hypothetical protein ACIBCT_08410 [Streptosporangium sp. NPDC050855]|uniref:hypothetical protein n=1 Tax=Streptosporangium sp. NPDC050855 TaxID=3366194 RepID=UPI0037B2EC5E